ncbi:NAD(P)-binding protein [Ascobolus immersus RN42]|uniref:NAD(P)-binding protein n=1 Tax=Ascobolus immersus RN42 TaxID=1160509 RepID=A0A3N4ISE1_ASCIM|nr:NAD(P)-binding protein [Ascobolus immersus RN42]
MSSIKNVTIIGSNSVLTKPTITALLSAGFNVSILSRAETTVDPSTFPSSVTLLSADYSSLESLTSALQGTDAIVSYVGGAGTNGLASQNKIIDAAVAAGVKRFLPSEFGANSENKKAVALKIFASKLPVQEHIIKAHNESGLEYDLVIPGLFFETALIHDFDFVRLVGISIPTKTADFLDGGNIPISLSTYDFIASAVVAILQRPASNGFVRVFNIQKTTRELLALVQEFTGREGWTITESKSEEVLEEADVLFDKGPEAFWSALAKQVTVAAGGKGFGNDFESDNEELGLSVLGDAELKELIKGTVERATRKAGSTATQA